MKLPETTRLTRMIPPADSIMLTVRKQPNLKPIAVRRSFQIKIPPTDAFEPYPKPTSFDPELTQSIDILHPDPYDRRTVALETLDQHGFNFHNKIQKERKLREKFHNAYSRYYYGDSVNKEIYRKYIRDSLKQQMTEKEHYRSQDFIDRKSESKVAVQRDKEDIENDLEKNRKRNEFLRHFRDFNKTLMDETAQKRKSEYFAEQLKDREVLQFNPINWSETLK